MDYEGFVLKFTFFSRYRFFQIESERTFFFFSKTKNDVLNSLGITRDTKH